MEKQNLVTLVNVISQSFVLRGRASSKLIFIIAYYVMAFLRPYFCHLLQSARRSNSLFSPSLPPAATPSFPSSPFPLFHTDNAALKTFLITSNFVFQRLLRVTGKPRVIVTFTRLLLFARQRLCPRCRCFLAIQKTVKDEQSRICRLHFVYPENLPCPVVANANFVMQREVEDLEIYIFLWLE